MAFVGPLFQIGSFSIYCFGVILAAVFLTGVFLFWRSARREGFSSDAIFDLVFLSSFAALLVGRLSFLLLTGAEIGLVAILRVGEGTFWAPAFLAGLGAFYLYTRRREEWSFSKLGDLVAPVLALGQGLVLLAAEAVSYLSSVAVVGFGYLGLFVVLVIIKRKFLVSGVVFSIYLLGSGFLTLLFEYWRVTKAVVFGVDLNYLLAGVLLLLGVLESFRSVPRLHSIVVALRRRAVIPPLFRRVEKQLRFKLQVKRRAIRLWSTKGGENNVKP